MWKLSLVALLLAGCVENEDTAPTRTLAQRAFIAEALPVLQQQCVACHGNATNVLGFMAGETADEIRLNLVSSGEVNIVTPTSSRLLTKGAHSGPYLTAAETSALLEWITAERDERQGF
jgi:hypothetical protein